MHATFVTPWLQVMQPLANVHETKWTPHVKRESDVAQSYTSFDVNKSAEYFDSCSTDRSSQAYYAPHNNQIMYAKVERSMHEVCHDSCRPTIMHRFVKITKFITNRSHLVLAIGAIPGLAHRLKTNLHLIVHICYFMYPVIKYHVCNYNNACMKCSMTCLQ